MVRDGRAGPVGPHHHPAAAAGARPRPACPSRSPATTCRWSATRRAAAARRAARGASTSTTTTPTHADVHRPRPRRGAAARSPLAGLDASDVRRARPAAAHREKARPRAGTPAAPLARAAPRPPWSRTASSRDSRARRSTAPRPGRAAAAGRPRCSAERSTAEEVLWTLWSRHRPGRSRLRRPVEPRWRRGRAGAHRDLDSLVRALRAAAAGRGAARPHRRRRRSWPPSRRSRSRPTRWPSGASAARPSGCSPPTGPRASSGASSSSPHVQQEGWPDLRRRATLLQADRIGARRPRSPRPRPAGTPRAADGGAPAVLRRRAPAPAERLVVTAVAVARRRRRAALAVPRRARRRRRPSVTGRPPRPLSLAGLVGRAASHGRRPRPSSTPLREAAARRLAALARRGGRRSPAGADRRPRRPGGAPAALSRSVEPSATRERPVPVSASMLESVLVCPAQWFFEREAGGVSRRAPVGQPRPAPARARRAGGPRRARRAETSTPLMAERRRRLGPARTSARPWSRRREHDRIAQGAGAGSSSGTSTTRASSVGTEQRFRASSTLRRRAGHAHRVRRPARARRRRPRRRRRPQDRPHRAVRAQSVARHLQLALYQYAVDARRRSTRLGRSATGGRRRRARAARRRTTTARPPSSSSRPTPDDGPERDGPARRSSAARPRLVRAESFPAVGRRTHCRDCPSCRSARPRARRIGDVPSDDAVDDARRSARRREDLGALMGRLRAQRRAVGGDPAPLRTGRRRSPAPARGKTTLMAARVVYLVATGQVRPDEVLGLTFTTKAASRAARQRSATPCCAAGLLDRAAAPTPARRATPSSRPWRPTTPTPPACSPTTACGSVTSPTPGWSPTPRATSSARASSSGSPATSSSSPTTRRPPSRTCSPSTAR